MGLRLSPSVIVDLSCEGSAVVGGKTWYWTFHDYLGPTFTDADGEPLPKQPGANARVWKAFEEWLSERRDREAREKEAKRRRKEGAARANMERALRPLFREHKTP